MDEVGNDHFLLEHGRYCQRPDFPYGAQFRHLVGEPNETVSALVIYPWRDNPQVSIPELSNTPHGSSIRIVSVERPAPVQTIIQRDLDPYIASSTAQDRALRVMRMLLKGQPGSSFHSKWLDLHGKVTELVLLRDGSTNRAALPSETWLPFEYKELPGHISYMALNDFSNEKIVGDFESRLEKVLQSKAWILDLRKNGGGTALSGIASWDIS